MGTSRCDNANCGSGETDSERRRDRRHRYCVGDSLACSTVTESRRRGSLLEIQPKRLAPLTSRLQVAGYHNVVGVDLNVRVFRQRYCDVCRRVN